MAEVIMSGNVAFGPSKPTCGGGGEDGWVDQQTAVCVLCETISPSYLF